MPNGHGDPKRPKFEAPELRAKFGPLLDSLYAAAGVPDSLVFRRLLSNPRNAGEYNWRTRTLTINPNERASKRRTLLHEFGHVLNERDPPLFLEWLDPEGKQRVPTATPRDLERFADALADAFDALSRRDTTAAARRPDVELLARTLAGREPFASDSMMAAFARGTPRPRGEKPRRVRRVRPAREAP